MKMIATSNGTVYENSDVVLSGRCVDEVGRDVITYSVGDAAVTFTGYRGWQHSAEVRRDGSPIGHRYTFYPPSALTARDAANLATQHACANGVASPLVAST